MPVISYLAHFVQVNDFFRKHGLQHGSNYTNRSIL